MRIFDPHSPLRPLAKNLIKQGLQLYDSAKQRMTIARDEFDKLVAEVRAESAPMPPTPSGEPIHEDPAAPGNEYIKDRQDRL